MNANNRGFTLLELLVVVTLIVAVTAMAGLRLAPQYRRAQAESAAEQLIRFEQSARASSWRLGQRRWLLYDLHTNQMRLSKTNEGRHGQIERTLRLPRVLKLAAVARTDANESSRRTVKIPIDRHGQSPSYAIELVTESDSDRKGQWIVFTGTTGSAERMYDESSAKRLMRKLATRGPDTH